MSKNSMTLYFSEMLLSLLKGKTSLIDALNILSSEGIDKNIRTFALLLFTIMKKGKRLSESLQLIDNKKISFEPMHLSLITTAEATGKIDEVLERIVYDLKTKQKSKENVQNILIYPSLIIVIAVIGTIIIITIGLPFFIEGGLLSSEVINDAIYGIILAGTILLLGGGFLFYLYYRIFYINSPEYTVFYILEFMLRSNITLQQALSYCLINVNDAKYKKELVMIRNDVISGVSLSIAFKKSKVFSGYISGWLSIADTNGNIIDICKNIKMFYENRDYKKRETAARLIEPVIILLTGFYILILILTVVLPMLTYAGGIL